MPDIVTILIADDHKIILDGIEAVLMDTRFKVVGRYTRGDEVLPAMERIRPSLLILDNRMPGLSGLEIIRVLSSRGWPARVLLLTGSLTDREALDAVRLGVQGLLLKDKASTDLLLALEALSRGDRWIDPEALEHAERFQEANLSDRESQMAELICLGFSNDEIARQAGISVSTVKKHIYNMYEKLGIENRAQLVRRFNRKR